MVIDYYKLTEQPFGVTPNPLYLYMTPTHREAMASILYGLMENRGFSALIAPPGMGKTTLLFEILQRFGQSMRTVFLFQFQPNPDVLLRNLLAELGIPDEGKDFADMQEKLNQAILQEAKNGRRTVVVVDETQNYGEPVLEALRMLSNFETSREKLIHIILSGQPQLAEILASPGIAQLRQRISIMAVLRPLNAQETRNYIDHRLQVAGYKSARPLFSPAAYELIAEYSGGIPRNINNYCFNAMSLGFALKQRTIGSEIISEVFRDLSLTNNSDKSVEQSRWRANAPQFGLTPSAIPKVSPPGRRARLTLGAISVATVFCLAGAFAHERLNSASRFSVTVPAPPPPVAVTESPAGATTSTADDLAKPEAETVVDSRNKSSGGQERDVQASDLPDEPTAKPERVRLVKASQHETLYQLCARDLARCDAEVLREIQRLNPWLHNAGQVQAGQPVLLPLEMPRKKVARPDLRKLTSERRDEQKF